MVSVPEMARHRKNPCLPVVHPTPIKQWNGGAEHPGLLDGLPFRWVSTVAALPVRTQGGKIIQRLGWLLLPPLRRQSDLRQPNQKHARSAPFPGVQAAPASRRRCVAYRSFSGAATRHASKDICAAATPGGEAGRGTLAASQAQADGLPKLGLSFAAF